MAWSVHTHTHTHTPYLSQLGIKQHSSIGTSFGEKKWDGEGTSKNDPKCRSIGQTCRYRDKGHESGWTGTWTEYLSQTGGIPPSLSQTGGIPCRLRSPLDFCGGNVLKPAAELCDSKLEFYSHGYKYNVALSLSLSMLVCPSQFNLPALTSISVHVCLTCLTTG